MADTTDTDTGDGTKKTFSFTFEYSRRSDVRVSLNGATLARYNDALSPLTNNPYTFNSAGNEIIFSNLNTASPTTLQSNTQVVTNASPIPSNSGAPKSGVRVLIYRDTNVQTAKTIYSAGSAVRAVDLNNNQEQILFFNQELEDNNNPKFKRDLQKGTSPPSDATDGYEGDLFIDTTNKKLYGPKSNGTWPTGVDLGSSSSFTVNETGKADGSVVYYDSSSSEFKADSTTTKLTLVDGGNFS